MSEWMKVMLEEVARKRTEAEQARVELERRGESPQPTPETPIPRVPENDPPQR